MLYNLKRHLIWPDLLFPTYRGKAGGIDHFSPERIDHLLPELIYYQLVHFNNEMKTGEMWSICSAFVIQSYNLGLTTYK